MVEFLGNFHPVTQALLATCFTCALNALGAATVSMVKEVSRKTLDSMLGFAAGVMIAASYWSLIAPAIEISEGKGSPLGSRQQSGFLWEEASSGPLIGYFPISIWVLRKRNRQGKTRPWVGQHF